VQRRLVLEPVRAFVEGPALEQLERVLHLHRGRETGE
jgi:hypothetical protein